MGGCMVWVRVENLARVLLALPLSSSFWGLSSLLVANERVVGTMEDAATRGADAGEARLNRLLNLILETAVDMLGYDAATISTRAGGELSTIGATDQRYIMLDDAQYESGEGPCVSVLDQRDAIFVSDLSDPEGEWDAFRQTAAYLGVVSSLSLHVEMDTEELAASLNLYSRQQLERSGERVRQAEAFAAQVAAALQGVDAYRSSARLAAQLAEAMRSRATIEQAKGILISEQALSPDQAFQRLVELSQHSNTKLAEVAKRLVEDRRERTPPAV